MYLVICFGFLIDILEERDVLCAPMTFFYAMQQCIVSGSPESYISHILVFTSVLGKCGSFPPCICPGKANTAFSLGKRNNDLHIAKFLGALQKNTYTALEKAL